MEQTILGLSLWAWLGYLFLVLSGIFLGIASMNSTKIIIKESVKKGVDSTLIGTEKQLIKFEEKLISPIRNLHSYLVNIHNPLNNQLLNKINLKKQIENAIVEKREGKEILKGGEHLTTEQLENTVTELKSKITEITNRYYASMETLRNIVNKTEDYNIIETFKIYDKLNQQIINGNSINDIQTEIGLSKSIYESIIKKTE